MKHLKKVISAFVTAVLATQIIACEENQDTPSSTATLTLNGSDSSVSGSSAMVADASSLKLKVYEAWVSLNGDCSDPVQVMDNPSATYQEFAGGINIGSGDITLGDYQCVIMVMSDNIRFTPAANDGAQCVAGTEYTADVCNSANPAALDFPDGSSGTCADGEDMIPVYLSTFSTTTAGTGGHNPFSPPTASGDSAYGFQLGSSLNVTGNTTNYFVVDVSNKIDGSGASCEMMPPDFSFE